jgi:3-methyladenine DNA glycosylase AlkD
VAVSLRGKNKPDFVPYKDMGDTVLVKNIDKMKFTGNKLENKNYFHYTGYLGNLKKWAKSENRWMKRASAVALIIPARHGKFLKDIFEIANIVLLDKDDLVQKGYGWMLKAASEVYQKEVFEYVMKNKDKMPRTAFRYAIEKMPKNLKTKAMAK